MIKQEENSREIIGLTFARVEPFANTLLFFCRRIRRKEARGELKKRERKKGSAENKSGDGANKEGKFGNMKGNVLTGEWRWKQGRVAIH
jgi:hypothetical protein